jgi:chemotaxis protein methyltransferase CheR
MTAAADRLEQTELSLLLEGLLRHYGCDFREYEPKSLLRRVRKCVDEERVRSISELLASALRDPAAFERLGLGLTSGVTALFRDPTFFAAFRAQVVPLLRTYPFARLWVAGCSTGEEVYSLAILLHEEGLYERCRIYATDLADVIVDRAKAGIFSLALLPQYSKNYQEAGGRGNLLSYFRTDNQDAAITAMLKRNICFSTHDLASSASFSEFNAVCCRNVMIYFNARLQARVHELIYESLAPLGFLCLGRAETARFSTHEADYRAVNEQERIYRRKG